MSRRPIHKRVNEVTEFSAEVFVIPLPCDPRSKLKRYVKFDIENQTAPKKNTGQMK